MSILLNISRTINKSEKEIVNLMGKLDSPDSNILEELIKRWDAISKNELNHSKMYIF